MKTRWNLPTPKLAVLACLAIGLTMMGEGDAQASKISWPKSLPEAPSLDKGRGKTLARQLAAAKKKFMRPNYCAQTDRGMARQLTNLQKNIDKYKGEGKQDLAAFREKLQKYYEPRTKGVPGFGTYEAIKAAAKEKLEWVKNNLPGIPGGPRAISRAELEDMKKKAMGQSDTLSAAAKRRLSKFKVYGLRDIKMYAFKYTRYILKAKANARWINKLRAVSKCHAKKGAEFGRLQLLTKAKEIEKRIKKVRDRITKPLVKLFKKVEAVGKKFDELRRKKAASFDDRVNGIQVALKTMMTARSFKRYALLIPAYAAMYSGEKRKEMLRAAKAVVKTFVDSARYLIKVLPSTVAGLRKANLRY